MKPSCSGCAMVVILLVSVFPIQAKEPSARPPAATVERFIAAYNAHDVDAMLGLAHPRIQWLSVDGDTVTVETTGVDALGTAMRDYFAAMPSTRSEIGEMMPAGRFVSVREHAHWESDNGSRTQSALTVYEVVAGKILRVWYYPHE